MHRDQLDQRIRPAQPLEPRHGAVMRLQEPVKPRDPHRPAQQRVERGVVVIRERVVGIGAAPAVPRAQATQRLERHEVAGQPACRRDQPLDRFRLDRGRHRGRVRDAAAGERQQHRSQLRSRSRQEADRALCLGLGRSEADQSIGPSGVRGGVGQDGVRIDAGRRRRIDALDEALPVDADQPSGDRDDRSGTAVVGGQLNPPRAGVERLEAQDSAHVGEAPGVDGLVVVADHEQVALRLGQQTHQAQLRRIHVLELVHAQVRESVLPAQAESWVRLQRIGRPDHQVVEVDGSS